MSQSLAQNLLHLVFSTKNRRPWLFPAIRPELNAYLAGTLRDLQSPAVIVNSVSDHVHILCALSKNDALCNIVEEIKRSSSKWIKTKGDDYKSFHWQAGYGAFSVSQSNVEEVRTYIANQEQHHARMSFQDELRAILKKHRLEFDERYLWD